MVIDRMIDEDYAIRSLLSRALYDSKVAVMVCRPRR